MNKPAYSYCRAAGKWRVDKMTYYENSEYGSKVAEFDTRDEARQEVYRLNGWKLKPINQEEIKTQ